MSMLTEYFILMAILFIGYLGIRWSLQLPSKRDDFTGKGIEADALTSRIRPLRNDITQARPPVKPAGLERALVAEAKREHLSKLAFFHAPPSESQAHEDEHGLHFLLV